MDINLLETSVLPERLLFFSSVKGYLVWLDLPI
jgi:hypothetical protein